MSEPYYRWSVRYPIDASSDISRWSSMEFWDTEPYENVESLAQQFRDAGKEGVEIVEHPPPKVPDANVEIVEVHEHVGWVVRVDGVTQGIFDHVENAEEYARKHGEPSVKSGSILTVDVEVDE